MSDSSHMGKRERRTSELGLDVDEVRLAVKRLCTVNDAAVLVSHTVSDGVRISARTFCQEPVHAHASASQPRNGSSQHALAAEVVARARLLPASSPPSALRPRSMSASPPPPGDSLAQLPQPPNAQAHAEQWKLRRERESLPCDSILPSEGCA